MKAELPLDDNGRMLCITCHDCITGSCILRESKSDLCAVCHDCTQGMACVLGIAHLGDSPLIKKLSFDSCYACHDSAVGRQQCNIEYLRSTYGDRVTCISCHDPYNTRHKKLMTNTDITDYGRDKDVCPRYFSPRRFDKDPRYCVKCHHEQ